MMCPHCQQSETRIYKQIFANRTVHVTERCPLCKNFPVKGKPFLSNYEVENIDALPVWGASDEEKQETKKPTPVYYSLNLRR